ncbi:MAG TPA: hypothetical protein VL547_12545 [Dinghuibacter sp.]|uniref:hypothetical protein n=1 Tax=Dinghuibacter sp. TaxID=2024697 RepID=UPI002C081C4A|nr:hypothetical protein [Dinghuibacter sp.]HTJ12855.1 hypothetical protein [Dinghuibacter sp.]
MRKAYLFVLFAIAGLSRSNAQQKPGVESILKTLSDSFPQERLYLHLDKDRYMAGDTVWFKAYFSSGGFPGGSSTGMHVELFNAAGNRIVQKYFPVLMSKLSLGDIELSDSLTQGLYTLRAWSDWMSNSDPDFFYHQAIPVYAATVTPEKGRTPKKRDVAAAASSPVEPAPAPGVDVQFLPEGGDEVTNVQGVVAFRATDQRGLPVAVSGRVVDDLDTVVTDFTTMHDGMGLLQLTPVKGRTYTAVVQTPLGQQRLPLPVPRPDGVVLNTRTTARGIGFLLRADTLSRYLGQPLQVVASLYGTLVFRAKTTLSADNPEISGFIPTDKFVPGIVTLTLFAPDGEPLAERVVFIRPSDIRRAATLTLDTLNLGARGYNAWNLHFDDTTTGYMSVSVTDADVLTPEPNRRNILTGLLLESDLKGNIYNPGFYFRDDADSTQALLDLVMRTHGWRRFDWRALEAGRLPVIKYTDKNYLSFHGQARTESGKKAVTNTLLTMFLRGNDSTKKLMITQLDSAGNFTLDGLVFFDTAQVYYQVNKKGWAGENVQLRMDPTPNFPISREQLLGAVFPEGERDTAFVGKGNREADLLAGLRRLQRAKELQEIVIKGHKKTPLEEMDARYTSGMFAGGDSHNFDLVNDHFASSYIDILTFLQGRVPGLIVSGAYPNSSARYRGGTPAFFVDEVNTDINMLEEIPVTDIAYVKVFPPPFFGATGGGPYGAIAIYTRRGGDETVNMPGLKRLTLLGYAPIRTFYSPVYTNHDSTGAYPDYRTTLAWSPFLFTSGTSHTVPVRFYNNDECKHVRIVVEGIDEDGKLLHFERVVDATGSGAVASPGSGAAKNP